MYLIVSLLFFSWRLKVSLKLKVSLWTVCACLGFILCIVSARPQEGSTGELWLLLCEEHQSWATLLIHFFPKFSIVFTLFSFIVLHDYCCIFSYSIVNQEPKVRSFCLAGFLFNAPQTHYSRSDPPTQYF